MLLNVFAIQMVGDLIQSGKVLSNGQIYSLIQPWLLGGEYKISNINPTDIEVHFSLSGQQQNKLVEVKANKPIIPTSTRCARFVGILGRYVLGVNYDLYDD